MARSSSATEPPGGQDRALARDAEDDLLLQAEEALGAQLVHEALQELAAARLQHKVRVQEGHAQRLGAQHAHRALAAARHPDEN